MGVAERAADDVDLREQLEELNEELEVLNAEARELEERIGENVVGLLEDSADEQLRLRLDDSSSRRRLPSIVDCG